MEQIEILEKKIHRAAELIATLRRERDQLRAELQFLEKENKRARELEKENEALREARKSAAVRIQHVLKKIQALKI